MKKIALLIVAAIFLAGCASVKEAQNLSNCTYALKSVEVTDYNVTSIGFVVTIAITNPNKKEPAKLKRFEGELSANDDKIADVTLKNINIAPNSTYPAKAKIDVPMSAMTTKMVGLLSMGSGTIDYHLTGTMYFEGPLGVEVPLPVDIGRVGSHNV